MSDSASPHDPYAALRLGEFRLFVFARLCLTISIQMQGVMIGWQLYELTRDPLALGLAGLAEAIPYIAVVLFAGHVADVVDRKKLMLFSTAVFLLGTLALLWLSLDAETWYRQLGIWPIYAVISLTGLARAFAGPAYSAFVAQLIPREIFANAATWNSTAWQIGAVTGPALGGLLYGFVGVTRAYGVNLALVLVTLGCLTLIARRPLPARSAKESLVESLKSGVRFVFHNQILLSALSLDLFAVFFGGAVALLPVFADQILKVGPQGLGLLRAAPAAGAVLMALALAYFPLKHRAGKALLWSVAGFGLCMIAFALSRNFYLSLGILALSGALDNVSVVVRHTILQLLTPDEMRGRVSAVNSVFIGSSNEIGAFESGAAARLIGLVPSVIFGGVMTLVTVGIIGKKTPQLRKLDLEKM